MPELDDIRASVADLLVDIVDADRNAIQPQAQLKELGVDSLSVIEVSELLGARYDVVIPDETIDRAKTVDDLAKAVTRAPVAGESGTPGNYPQRQVLTSQEIEERKRRALVLIGWFVVVGVAIGLAIGVGGAAALRSLGLGDVEPIPMPTFDVIEGSPTPTTSPSPNGEEDEDEDEDEEEEPELDEPTLEASPATVAANTRVTLSGTVPGAEPGSTLQVQHFEGGQWNNFPVTVTLGSAESFSFEIASGRIGAQQFRIQVVGSDIVTPPVSITIQ